MKLKKDEIEDFRYIYTEETGQPITLEEAVDLGSKLLRVVELIYKPRTRAELAAILERQEWLEDTRIIEA